MSGKLSCTVLRRGKGSNPFFLVDYTSQAYFDLSQEYHFQPSMSSPGCPYDNAAMENFFGTLKTECLYRINFACRAEVEQAVAEYVQFYNYERINMKDGLTPFEIRSKAA